MIIAAHAAAPTCPRCNTSVRSGVEIQAAAADLAEFRAAIQPLATSPNEDERDLHETALLVIAHRHRELHAELAGEHLDCSARNHDDSFVALVLRIAADHAAAANPVLS